MTISRVFDMVAIKFRDYVPVCISFLAKCLSTQTCIHTVCYVRCFFCFVLFFGFFALYLFRSSGERLATAGQLPTHSGLHHHVPPDRVDGAEVHEEQAAFLLQGDLSVV